MEFDDLREIFHLYVPEYDFKSPLSETDKWNIIVNVGVSVALIVALLLFALFCKLKHRWLVNAKCAFCNCAVRVWRAKLYWWFCNHCQRINGYPKNSFVHTDSSSVDNIQEVEDDSCKLKELNVSNNKIKSPSNQRKLIIYSKNDLNDSIIISRSPREFENKETDVFQYENSTQIETSFQQIRNKIQQMLDLNRGIEKLSNDDTDDDTNANSTRLPVEMSNLRKMHMKLIMDDVNRRYELLNAEKTLCAKMKQMKELEKSLRDAKKNSTRDPSYLSNESFNRNSHSIRRRNTFFERSINHSITSPTNSNGKDVNLTKDAVATRLAILESHLTELRDMHVNEIKLLKSQIENNTSIVKKLEYLKFEMVEYHEKIRRDYDMFNSYKTTPQFNSTEELRFENPNQMLHSTSESGYSSETGETKNHLVPNSEVKNEMPVIIEECDDSEKNLAPRNIEVLKMKFDRIKQDNKQTLEEVSKLSIAQRRGARIVKPIKAGQRPARAAAVAAASKVVQSRSTEQ